MEGNKGWRGGWTAQPREERWCLGRHRAMAVVTAMAEEDGGARVLVRLQRGGEGHSHGTATTGHGAAREGGEKRQRLPPVCGKDSVGFERCNILELIPSSLAVVPPSLSSSTITSTSLHP